MDSVLLYKISLTHIPHIGPVQAKILLQQYPVEDIFKARKTDLEKLEGIGTIRANAIHSFREFSKAEQEIKFLEKYAVRPLFITDKDYPQRLLHCYDSPTLLYYKGEANLNASRIVAVIGTRNHTDYGKQLTEKLIKDLAAQKVMVLSGLAFGIDALAHKAAIKNSLTTVAVLAHGLDQVYPYEHAGLAREMIRNGGGLLSEFAIQTKPDKHNFPIRNRIVAGMSDATIVIETGIRGGSMITAELANGYNKDVFAFPGKVTDHKSSGCNHLIKTNKAILITEAAELVQLMGWEESIRKTGNRVQKELFIELSAEEKIIVNILNEKDMMHIDEINIKSGLNSSAVAAAILNMELQGLIRLLPGKMYRLD